MGSPSIDNVPLELFEQTYKAKKSLGQNFIKNEGLINKILGHIDSLNPSTVIEIGPGLGAFTKHLTNKYQLLAIEYDEELCKYITLKYPDVDLYCDSALDVNMELLINKCQQPVHIFGALPYNISKPIIRKVLELPNFSTASFIIQKEVADKYLTSAPDASKLSLTTQLYATPTKIFDINPANFSPKPKVTSTYLSFTSNSPKTIDNISKKDLSALINQIFTAPRKTIGNNLKKHYEKLPQTPILDKRAQSLTLEMLIELYQSLQ